MPGSVQISVRLDTYNRLRAIANPKDQPNNGIIVELLDFYEKHNVDTPVVPAADNKDGSKNE